MTRTQIARSYRTAKDKKKQIEILADMEHMTKAQIERILIDEGEIQNSSTTEKKAPGRPRKTTANKTVVALKQIEENKTAAVKETPSEELKAIPLENSPQKEPFKKVLPSSVYDALYKETQRIDAEINKLIDKKAEITEFLLREGIDNE